jgi:hypothetical protein
MQTKIAMLVQLVLDTIFPTNSRLEQQKWYATVITVTQSLKKICKNTWASTNTIHFSAIDLQDRLTQVQTCFGVLIQSVIKQLQG